MCKYFLADAFTPAASLFHYRVREDEAQDSGDELEQEDHRQGDTELGGNRERWVNINLFSVDSSEDRFHESLCHHANSADAY